MSRVSFIEHKGKRIIYNDFTEVQDTAVALAAVAASRELTRKQPLGSCLILTHVTGSRFNRQVVEALKELANGNKPYVKGGCIVGLSGIQRVVYVAITQFTGRRMPTFSSLEEAKDYLAALP